MMASILIPAIQQTLLFIPLCLGMYLTYCVMDTTDLTVEATFVLGAGVFSRIVVGGLNQYLAIILAVLAGALVGFVVALIQKVARLNALITSILAIFMLYSINFKVLGRPNISLLATDTLIQFLQNNNSLLLWIGIGFVVVMLAILMCITLHTNLGLLLRTYGDNSFLLSHLAKSRFVILSLGLMASNALAAFSGLLTAQINGYADVNMGLGVALTAIGSMMIGITTVRQLRKKNACFKACYDVLGCFAGVGVYFIAMNTLLFYGLDPIYIKLALGVLLLVFLSGSQLKLGGKYYV